MTDAAAFRATIHGLRTVPSRKVVQVVVEAPIEHLTLIAKVAEHGAWVGVARLTEAGKEGDVTASAEASSMEVGERSRRNVDAPPQRETVSVPAGAKSPAQIAGYLST